MNTNELIICKRKQVDILNDRINSLQEEIKVLEDSQKFEVGSHFRIDGITGNIYYATLCHVPDYKVALICSNGYLWSSFTLRRNDEDVYFLKDIETMVNAPITSLTYEEYIDAIS